MKRIVGLILVLALLLASVSGYAEKYDFSSFSDADLADLQKQVQIAIEARANAARAIEREALRLKGADFLADEDRYSTFFDLNRAYDYTGMVEMLNEYVAATPEIAEIDTVNLIKPLIAEGSALLAKCLREHDKFENEIIIFCDGFTDVSRQICFAPRVEGSDFECKIGFVADDWIFFDRAMIASDNNKSFSVLDSNPETEVLDNGDVMEYGMESFEFHDDDIENLKTAVNPVIRFFNKKNNKYIDHDITPGEAEAVCTLFRLVQIQDEIRDVLHEWRYE